MKVLLIEDSETCSECLLGIYNRRWFCLATGKDIDLLKSRYEKPSWCPLRPLPDRENPTRLKDGTYFKAYDTGWNDCLDEIMGETE